MDYRSYIAERIAIEGISASEIAGMMTVPPDLAMGDYALPCFRFAKVLSWRRRLPRTRSSSGRKPSPAI